MSRHFMPPEAAGGAAVGMLADLDPASRTAVLSLRLWCDRGGVALADALGPEVAEAFARFCAVCLTGARRPLVRHGGACPCLGADEAALAAFLRIAATGERGDAMMLGFAMLRPEAVPGAVAAAQQAGLMLRRAMLQSEAARATLH
jgi:hypothetical protein